MNLFRLELRLLGKDLLKIGTAIFFMLLVSTLLAIGNNVLIPAFNSSDVMKKLFGSSESSALNWLYWMALTFGYLLILQIAWKTRPVSFAIYQIVRYRDTRLYWQLKIAVGLSLTVFYVLCYLGGTIVTCLLTNVAVRADPAWVLVFISLALNFFLHGLLWLNLQIFASAEVATLSLAALFYGGFKFLHPYFPLYYAMTDHVERNWLVIFGLESVGILVLLCLLHWKVKNKDLEIGE